MRVEKFAKDIIILMIFSGIYVSLFPGKTFRVVLETASVAIVGYYFLNAPTLFKKIVLPRKRLFNLYVYYTFIVFLHGCFVAKNYEQWRILITVFLPIIILPFFSFLATIPELAFIFIKHLLSLGIPLSFVFFLNSQMYRGENVFYIQFTSFLYLLILILPYVNFKWRVYIVVTSIISLMLNLESRSNIISILFSYGLLILLRMVKLNALFFDPIVRTMRLVFFIVPFVLVTLGYFGVYNIFQYLEKRDAEQMAKAGGDLDKNLAIDSRTSIYQDAVESINTGSKLLFGISPTAYYKTTLSDIEGQYEKGRLSGAEAAILNFFQWGGLVYALLVFLIFYFSSYYALFKSNNFIIKLLGIFISFRWLYLFIENPVAVNFFWITMFVVFGICLSPKFRKMTDDEIKIFFTNL